MVTPVPISNTVVKHFYGENSSLSQDNKSPGKEEETQMSLFFIRIEVFMIEIITHSKEETQELAYKLGQSFKQGMTILLIGDLGAGKTTFTQGLAKGLGVTSKVNSPTFVIMKEYEGRIPLVHIDAYRLEGVQQDLGFEDYTEEEVVKIIEWPQYYYESLEDKNVIRLERLDENSRLIQFDFKDESMLKEILL